MVTGEALDNTARLDGFTITGGLADGNHGSADPDVDETGRGGGILLKLGAHQLPPNPAPSIVRCRIEGNGALRGGGLYMDSNPGSTILPTLANLEFRDNDSLASDHVQTEGDGGGAYSGLWSQELWVNCLFAGNTAVRNGAGLYDAGGTAQDITNCTFADNVADGDGGGLYLEEEDLAEGFPIRIANSIFWNNVDAGGMDAGAQITVIVHGAQDVTLTRSDVEGGPVPPGVNDGGANLNPPQDPRFVAPAAGNYRLLACSPCVEAGSDAELPPDKGNLDGDFESPPDLDEPTPRDLDMMDRRQDSPDGDDVPRVDMGPYELPEVSCPWDCADPPDGVIDVVDFLALLSQWGQECTSCDLTGGPGVTTVDFLALLQAWEPGCGGGLSKTVEDCIDTFGIDPVALQECICKVEPCTSGCPPENCQ